MTIGVTGPKEYFGRLNRGASEAGDKFTSQFMRRNQRLSTAVIQNIIGQKDESEAITMAVDFYAYLLARVSKGSSVVIRDPEKGDWEILKPPAIA